MPRIAVVGESALDCMFPHAHLTYEGRVAQVILPSRVFQIMAETKIEPGLKSHGMIPDSLWDWAADFRYGGGYVNSSIAIKLIAPEVAMRCVDECRVDARLRRSLGYPGLDLRGLSLQDIPRNAVFRDGHNRTIFKSKVSSCAAVAEQQRETLLWSCECPCVLGNSIKRPSVMEFLAREAKAGRNRLSIVLTGALPFEFVQNTALPAASVLFASLDEIGDITGWDVEQTIESAFETALRLQRVAPAAIIYLTLGKEGVVVTGPDLESPYCVRLALDPWAEVQRIVAENPARLCGAGDAFAGGVTVYLECLATLAAGLDGHYPPAVNAAISGCAASVRWIGLERVVGAVDFQVSSFPMASVA
jgi:sugar/nucleoside kinase (ribokinase family)